MTSRACYPRPFILSRRGILAGGVALLASRAFPAEAENEKPTGSLEIVQWQVAFIGSGNLGGGKLHFQGQTYPFTVGGLGIGGFGISKMECTGAVYGLKRLADFPGAYVQGRYGAVVADVSGGKLWLKNANGVGMGLEAKRQGLALSLGGDAVYINLD